MRCPTTPCQRPPSPSHAFRRLGCRVVAQRVNLEREEKKLTNDIRKVRAAPRKPPSSAPRRPPIVAARRAPALPEPLD